MANAAILVRLTGTAHADPAKDRRGCWKRWDPVAVYPFEGGAVPGSEERPPAFFWLLLFGASAAKARRFLQEEFDTADGLPAQTTGPEQVRYRRRLYRCGDDTIPAGVMNTILSTGRLRVGGPTPDVTWTQLRAYVRNKRTNQTEEQLGTTIEDLA